MGAEELRGPRELSTTLMVKGVQVELWVLKPWFEAPRYLVRRVWELMRLKRETYSPPQMERSDLEDADFFEGFEMMAIFLEVKGQGQEDLLETETRREKERQREEEATWRFLKQARPTSSKQPVCWAPSAPLSSTTETPTDLREEGPETIGGGHRNLFSVP